MGPINVGPLYYSYGKCYLEYLKERGHFEDLGVDGG